MYHKDVLLWTQTLIDHGVPGDLARKLVEKMVKGVKKYGNWDPGVDIRNYKEEILEELYDSMNYATMGILTTSEPEREQYVKLLSALTDLACTLRR